MLGGWLERRKWYCLGEYLRKPTITWKHFLLWITLDSSLVLWEIALYLKWKSARMERWSSSLSENDKQADGSWGLRLLLPPSVQSSGKSKLLFCSSVWNGFHLAMILRFLILHFLKNKLCVIQMDRVVAEFENGSPVSSGVCLYIQTYSYREFFNQKGKAQRTGIFWGDVP